jgi:hypothetical protein
MFFLAFFSCGAARAIDFDVQGYADGRLVLPGDQVSWTDGGLGKLRYGKEDAKPDVTFAEAAVQGSAVILPELLAVATIRSAYKQSTPVDLLEGYLRYRPVSTSAFRWSVKGGAFFPPVSLENTEIGWTSPWTLTPSAINSWIGEEVRIIGAEGTVEWRSDARNLSLSAAAFRWNEPAGVLLADRGWSLSDAFTGVFGEVRLPDLAAQQQRLIPPLRTKEIMQIDGRTGWYAAAQWDEAAIGKLNFIAYDNEADPTATYDGTIAWRTAFQDVGFSTQSGRLTLLAQGMMGQTAIRPSPFFTSDTHFSAGYVLFGWNLDENRRVAGRVDLFGTTEHMRNGAPGTHESGNALTAAVSYLPYDWLRITAEGIRVDSTRNDRRALGLPARAVEDQAQLSVRLYLP